MMVKDEEKRIGITIESCIEHVDRVIILDTGSKDKTKEIIDEICKKRGKKVIIEEGEFIDYATSRNILLDICDKKSESYFILLMDGNDELRNGEELRKFCEENKDTQYDGYMVNQQWYVGYISSYYYPRLLRPNKGWRYTEEIHEYPYKKKNNVTPKIEKVIIYQDRSKDEGKSMKRFANDKRILLEDLKKNPNKPRTVFYLAQTCFGMGDIEESLEYYKLRTRLEGFSEEIFYSYLRCAECYQQLKYSWNIIFDSLWNAFLHTPRAEPLISISNYYMLNKQWLLSYFYAKLACDLPYPSNSLFLVNNDIYHYHRWNILSQVAIYAADSVDPSRRIEYLQNGRISCLISINNSLNDSQRSFHTKYLVNYPDSLFSLNSFSSILPSISFPSVTNPQIIIYDNITSILSQIHDSVSFSPSNTPNIIKSSNTPNTPNTSNTPNIIKSSNTLNTLNTPNTPNTPNIIKSSNTLNTPNTSNTSNIIKSANARKIPSTPNTSNTCNINNISHNKTENLQTKLQTSILTDDNSDQIIKKGKKKKIKKIKSNKAI